MQYSTLLPQAGESIESLDSVASGSTNPFHSEVEPFQPAKVHHLHDDISLEHLPPRQNSYSKPEARFFEEGGTSDSLEDVFSKDENHVTIPSGVEIPTGYFKGQRLLYLISIFVNLGVLIFGYDQGVMSGIVTERSFVQYFDDPTRAQIGTMVAILEIGALLSSLAVGHISDKFGRRKTIVLGAFVFVVGGFIQTFSSNLIILSCGRVISGLGIGLLSAIVPVYQSEISPSHARGRLGCIEFTGNIFGYAASVWVDFACSFDTSAFSWRTPLLIQCFLGTILLVGGFFIVESPRWLLSKDKDFEGFQVLARLFADAPQETCRKEFENIKKQVYHERRITPPERATYRDLFRNYGYRVFIACSVQMWQQLDGINVISYYAPMVFEQAGFKDRAALLVTGINALIYLASTIPTWFLVDKWGRRPIFISGGLLMGIALMLIAIISSLDKPFTPMCVGVLVIIYNAAFGYSFGPLAWLYAPEIFSQSVVRSKGASLSTATNWLFNFIVGEVSPILLETIKWRLYLIFSIFCFCSAAFAYYFYPETSGVELEDMDELFENFEESRSKEGVFKNLGSVFRNGYTRIF